MLLSDLWSSRRIDAIRPISALNTSFPSTHVSLTVVVIGVTRAAGSRPRAMVNFVSWAGPPCRSRVCRE